MILFRKHSIVMLETTIVALVIAGVAFFAFLIRSCYMSKCRRVKLCCLEVERDTSQEQNVSQLKFDIPKI
jgi:hypothetical protein